jgi:hypothetical protein
MTLQLINQWGPCPPDGYRYVFPSDGYVVHAWTYVDWIAAAKGHLQANTREVPPNLEAAMQEQLCSTLPPGYCIYDDPNRPRPSTSLSWNDVMRGIETFGRWIRQGANYVSQPEADRRAAVCSRCYLNVHVAGCAGCQKAVQEIVRNKKTKYDDVLRTCAVCKCFLRAKVHFPIETLDTDSAQVQTMYPDFCWLNKDSENYRPAEAG